MEILRLYFPLCYRPVLLFLCHFSCSPAFLLFRFYSFFVYKWPISLLKRHFPRAKMAWSKKFSWGFTPRPQFVSLAPRDHGPEIFLARTATVERPRSVCILYLCAMGEGRFVPRHCMTHSMYFWRPSGDKYREPEIAVILTLAYYCARQRSKLTNGTRQLRYVIARLPRHARKLLTAAYGTVGTCIDCFDWLSGES